MLLREGGGGVSLNVETDGGVEEFGEETEVGAEASGMGGAEIIVGGGGKEVDEPAHFAGGRLDEGKTFVFDGGKAGVDGAGGGGNPIFGAHGIVGSGRAFKAIEKRAAEIVSANAIRRKGEEREFRNHRRQHTPGSKGFNGGDPCLTCESTYCVRRRRRIKPTAPNPSSASDAGSGTIAG